MPEICGFIAPRQLSKKKEMVKVALCANDIRQTCYLKPKKRTNALRKIKSGFVLNVPDGVEVYIFMVLIRHDASPLPV